MLFLHVIFALGLRLTEAPRPSTPNAMATRIAGMTATHMASHNKAELESMLEVFARTVDSRATKAELLAAMNHLKSDIASGSVDLDGDIGEQSTLTEDHMVQEAVEKVCHSFREASLAAWVMKPLVETAAMKEGTRNEAKIVEAMPNFLKTCGGAYRCPVGSWTYQWDEAFLCDVKHVRLTGLLESRRCSMLTDSPNALLAATDYYGDVNAFAVEFMTMTSLRTIEASKVLWDKYGCVISLENVGIAESSTKLFRELVPTTSYREQGLHHAATLGLNNVLYVVGTVPAACDRLLDR